MWVVLLAVFVSCEATRDSTCKWQGSCMPTWMAEWFTTAKDCNSCASRGVGPACGQGRCSGNFALYCSVNSFDSIPVCHYAPNFVDADTNGQAACDQNKNKYACDRHHTFGQRTLTQCVWKYSICFYKPFLEAYEACAIKDGRAVTEGSCPATPSPTEEPTDPPTTPPSAAPSAAPTEPPTAAPTGAPTVHDQKCKTFKARNDFQGCDDAPHCKAKGKRGAGKLKKCKDLKCKRMRRKSKCDKLAASPLGCVWTAGAGKGSKGRCGDPPKE